jgi:hypothetical protein
MAWFLVDLEFMLKGIYLSCPFLHKEVRNKPHLAVRSAASSVSSMTQQRLYTQSAAYILSVQVTWLPTFPIRHQISLHHRHHLPAARWVVFVDHEHTELNGTCIELHELESVPNVPLSLRSQILT